MEIFFETQKEPQRYFIIKKYVTWGKDYYEANEVKPVRAVRLRDDGEYGGGCVQEGDDFTLEEVMAKKEVLCVIFLEGGNGEDIVQVSDLFLSRESAEEYIKKNK